MVTRWSRWEWRAWGLAALLLTGFALAAGTASARTLAEGEAKLEIVLDARTEPPREKEMILATLRGTFDTAIARYDIEIPRMPAFEWVQLTRDAWRSERVDGKQVRIMERRIAFFPQRAGSLTILPIRDMLTIAEPLEGWVRYDVVSEPVTVEVEPSLAEAGEWWLPAKMIELSDRWDKGPGELEPGATVVRRVTLWALGVTAQMLPSQPPMREPWLITFIGPEKRTTELTWGGPISTVTWEWTFQPMTGEPGVLPQVEIPFFDTLDREVHAVTLPATPIAVAGFGENRLEEWSEGFGRLWLLAVFAAFGGLVTLAVALPGARLATVDEVRSRVRRIVPSRAERALMRAARAGDLTAFRTAALALAGPAATGAGDRYDEAEPWRSLEPVDRALFAGSEKTAGPSRTDLVALARRLRRQARMRGPLLPSSRPSGRRLDGAR